MEVSLLLYSIVVTGFFSITKGGIFPGLTMLVCRSMLCFPPRQSSPFKDSHEHVFLFVLLYEGFKAGHNPHHCGLVANGQGLASDNSAGIIMVLIKLL